MCCIDELRRSIAYRIKKLHDLAAKQRVQSRIKFVHDQHPSLLQSLEKSWTDLEHLFCALGFLGLHMKRGRPFRFPVLIKAPVYSKRHKFRGRALDTTYFFFD